MQNRLQEVTLILIASSVIILMLTVIIIAALFINQKRKFRYRQQMENQKKIFDQEILRAQLEIQTQTFETISRELHDNVSNTISVALLNLNLATNGLDSESRTRMNETKALLLEAKNNVKDFSWFINPENINNTGLSSSFAQLVEKFNRLNFVAIIFSISGIEFPVESSRQIIIYRIVQEAFSNVVKHSAARTIQFNLAFNYPLMEILIRDDGQGFNTSDVYNSTMTTHGAGLKNMIARAKMIGAHLEISSEPGNGTALSLSYSDTVAAHEQNSINPERS